MIARVVVSTRLLAMAFAAVLMLLPGSAAILSSARPDLSYENRVAVSWPNERTSWESRLKGYQQFFEDRLGWRSYFIALRNRISAGVGLSPNPLARLGRDGWLMATVESALLNRAGLTRFDEDTVRKFQSQIAARVNFWRHRTIAYYLLLGPDKSSIYPEQLDPLFPVRDTAFDDVYRSYGRSVFGQHFIDPRDALRRDKTRPSYFKGDSHWNTFGARIAYRRLMGAIASDFLTAAAIDDKSYVVAWRAHKGDLVPHGLEESYAEQGPYIVPDANGCGANASVARPAGADDPFRFHIRLATCPTRELTALVVHDSFGLALEPFLARTFGRTLFAWMPVHGDIPGELVDDAARIAGPIDIIIQVRVERGFLKGKLD
jgi:alginate O-acetyltransferase complex protein AlgJ